MDDASLEERVAEIQAMKRFGEEELGMDFWRLFTEVKEDRSPAGYSLYASRADRFESVMPYYLTRKLFFWWAKPVCRVPLINRIAPALSSFFRSHGTPLVTRKLEPFCASYRDEGEAESEAELLRQRGHDVWLYRSMARADSPALSQAVLNGDAVRKMYTIFHEGAHTTFSRHYREGRLVIPKKMGRYLPSEIDEPMACHVGHQASLDYAARHDPASLQPAEEFMERWERIVEFTNTTYDRLAACYRERSDRSPILAEADEEARGLGISEDINNAYIVHLRQYTEHHHLIKEAFEGVDIRDFIARPEDVYGKIWALLGDARG